MIDDILSQGDRLTLEIARRHDGRVEIELWREGRQDPDGEALSAHCLALCRGGFLRFESQGGSKARMQGARLVAVYRWTEAGRTVLALIDRLEDSAAAIAA